MYCHRTAILGVGSATILSHNYHFFFVVVAIMNESLCQCNGYNTTILLSIFTTQCIGSLGLIYLLVSSWYPTQRTPSSLSPSSQKSTDFKSLRKVRIKSPNIEIYTVPSPRWPSTSSILSEEKSAQFSKPSPHGAPSEESALTVPPRNLFSSKNPSEALTGVLSVLGVVPQSKKSLV